jgi:hypothetical protein
VQEFDWGQVRVSGFKMLNEFIWPADSHDDKKFKRKKKVRAHKILAFFARLAFTSPGKKCDKLINPTVRVSC